MTGHEDNVGFVATGSGVKQFQLSLGECFVLQCRRLSTQLKLSRHTSNLRASAAVQKKTGTFDLQDTVQGTHASGVPENVPVRAYQCLDWGVSRGHAPFVRDGAASQARNLMKTGVKIISLAALCLVLGASLRAQATPNFYAAGADNSEIGDRIPLILVHSILEDASIWNAFLNYYNSVPTLKDYFKPYVFEYKTRDTEMGAGDPQNVSGLGQSLGAYLAQWYASPAAGPTYGFNGKPVVILAHSMGGLVARSMMTYYLFGPGVPGSDKVSMLITLATPHHGSALANEFMDAYPLAQYFVGLYYGFAYNMAWDCYDGRRFSGECGLGIPSSVYYSKIVAYGAQLTPPGPDSTLNTGHWVLCQDGYCASDGAVPIESALFYPNPVQMHYVDGSCDHNEICNGSKTVDTGFPIFASIRADLLTLISVALPPAIYKVSPSSLTGLPLPQTQRIQIIGSGFTISSTLVFNDGSNSYNSDPARLTFVNANELDYAIAVGINPATWTVKVTNGGQTSSLGSFTVVSPSSAINLTCYVSPSTVSPNAAFTVSGTATYNNGGGAVVAGTVTISISGQTYTAAISSGSYSGQIAAPSAGGTYAVSVTATDGSGLTGANSASLVVNSNGTSSGYTIDNFFTCTNADSAYPYDAYGEIDSFGSAAPRFYAWLELGNVTGAHSMELRLYRPDGSYFGNATGTAGAAGQTYDWWRIWWYWNVSGYDIAYTPGLWDIQLYIDGVYQQSISFTIRYQFTKHLMAKGVQSTTPFDPIQPSNIFYQTDLEALTWLNLDKVSDAINVKWIFYEPSGSEYTETTYSSPSPVSSGYPYWNWYKYWGEINIVGNSAANKCGSWKVDVMIQDPSANWVKQYTDYFQIIESPPQPPVCTVGLTPINPISGQTLTLNVSATDNTYLQSLVLYWNDGSLHSHVWNNVIASSINQSQSIGTYTTGQQIEYWAVATDTSGNTTESIHKFAVIPDTTPPTLAISSPANYATVTNATLAVSGTATDSGNGNNGITLVTVDGIAANGGTASGSGTANWNATIVLSPGANTVTVVAKDTLSNSSQQQITVTYNPPDMQGPALAITSPANNATVTSASLPVSGTATDAGYGNNGISSVTVNGVSASGGTASGTGTANWNATITLNPGVNTITAVAKDTFSNSGQQQITVTYNASAQTNIVFSDDFNDNTIDPNKWTTSGNTVAEASQVMQVLTTVTDQGGILTSVPVPINSHGDITITRSALMHYANQYYVAAMNVEFGNLGWAGVQYANYFYPSTYYGWEDRYGIYLSRNDVGFWSSFIGSASDTNIAGPFPPIWDTWFTEKLVYSPDTGNLQYYTNDQKVADYFIGVMPPTNAPTIQFQFQAWGWYTGHQQLFDDLLVMQASATPALNQLTGMSVSNSVFRFVLNGPVGSNYVIQVSSNLVNWMPLSTNTIPVEGYLIINDPLAAGRPLRFYRAVLVNGQSVGSVSAWGDNTYGQTNVPPDLTDATAISAGFYHSLALKADGTVAGWGQNAYGETNVPVGLSSVTSVAAGWGTSLALKRDGTLEEWGWDGGYGLKATAESLTNIKAIAACWDCFMALRNDNTVFVWGKSTHGETNVPAGLNDVTAIAGGGWFCMALNGDGTVVTWGSNAYGQTNTPADLSGVTAIAAGGDHCLALKSDGTAVAWGYNYYGQTDVPSDLTNAVAVSAGAYHSLALRADGTLVAWGLGSSGQTNIPPGLHGVTAISAGGFHNLALVAGSYPMQLSGVNCLPGGQVQFTVSGLAGDVYRVLGSTNLHDWQTIASLANLSGFVQFADPGAAGRRSLFAE